MKAVILMKMGVKRCFFENTNGWQGTHISELPLEMALTINNSWGFNLMDDDHKDHEELVQRLVKAAGEILICYLTSDLCLMGRFSPGIKHLWQKWGNGSGENGQTVYGTRGGPVSPEKWGISTIKGNKVYLHILDWPEGDLMISGYKPKIKSITFYKDQSPVRYKRKKEGLLLQLEDEKRKDIDTIVEITIK